MSQSAVFSTGVCFLTRPGSSKFSTVLSLVLDWVSLLFLKVSISAPLHSGPL